MVVVRVVVVVGVGVVVRIGIGLEVVVIGFLADFCLSLRVFCCNLFHQGIVVWMGALEVEVVVDGVVIWFHQVLWVVEESPKSFDVDPFVSRMNVSLTAVPVRRRKPSP